jgi:hypothetical protein
MKRIVRHQDHDDRILSTLHFRPCGWVVSWTSDPAKALTMPTALAAAVATEFTDAGIEGVEAQDV